MYNHVTVTLGPSDRESIWSIPRAAKSWYFSLFGLQFIAGAVLLWLSVSGKPGSLSDAIETWTKVAPLAIASAATSLILVEVWGSVSFVAGWLRKSFDSVGILLRRSVMVLGEYLREKFNVPRKERRPKRPKHAVPYDHSLDRPPKAFQDSIPGKVKPNEAPD